jgi:cytochrome P450/NADPH-cytochrome P450 reductase
MLLFNTAFTAVLRETLRQSSPITQRGVEPLEDVILEDGGKQYAVSKGASITALNSAAHMDTAVYGEDVSHQVRNWRYHPLIPSQVAEFKPERMMDGKFEALPVCRRYLAFGLRYNAFSTSQTPGNHLEMESEPVS